MAGAGGKRAAGDLVFIAVTVIAIILVGFIVFVLIGANAQNDIVKTDADWSGFFATWFKDLFTPKSYKLNIFLNYGLATLVYLAVGGILRRVLNDAFA
jgi:ABC-type uncharacterized transport system permease subunit